MKILAAKVADGTLSQYVVIRHDKDVVSDNDVEKAPYLQLGALKAPHIHEFLKFPNSRRFDEIANWFGICGHWSLILYFVILILFAFLLFRWGSYGSPAWM